MATRNMKTVIKFLSTLQRQPTAAQMVSKWKKKFKNVGIEDYKLSAEYLVGFVCGKVSQFIASDVSIHISTSVLYAVTLLCNIVCRLARGPPQQGNLVQPQETAKLIIL